MDCSTKYRDAEAVKLPMTQNPLTLTDYTELQQTIDPSMPSDNHGIDQYLLTVEFVESKVLQY